MTKNRQSRRFAFLCGVLLLLLACTTLGDLTGTGRIPSPESGEDTNSQIDLWLGATAALPSTNLELVTEYSDREPKRLFAETDSAGNTHLSIAVPVSPAFYADQPSDAPLPGDFELFIVDGKAYSRIGGEGEAVQNDSYLTMLVDALNGPEGPGLWLNIVPDQDYTPAGTEAHGGFTTAKYTVEGSLENGGVSGTIWVDSLSNALVGAELTVAEGLFFPPGSNGSGDVRITLTVRQITVPAITLP